MEPCLWAEETKNNPSSAGTRRAFIHPKKWWPTLKCCTNVLNSPHFRHGVTRRRGLGGLPLHARCRVNSVFLGLALGLQGDVWRRVTDLHSCLWRSQGHRWWGDWGHWSLHGHHGRHRSGLSGHVALRRLTAAVCRGVHSRVYGLIALRLRGHRAHCGIEMPLHLLGGGRKPSLPPWYPAKLPRDKERDPEQSQTAGGHNQWQQADGNIWKCNKRNRNEGTDHFSLLRIQNWKAKSLSRKENLNYSVELALCELFSFSFSQQD